MARPKKIQTPDFYYTEVVKQEQQLYRTRTNATTVKVALNDAENPMTRNRYNLMRIYQNITLDSTLAGLMNQRLLSILSHDFEFINSKKENVEVGFENATWFNSFIEYTFESLFWGFSFIQLNDIVDNKLTGIELIPRVYCRPDFDIVSGQQQTNTGYQIDEDPYNKWVIPVYKHKHDLGLFTKIMDLTMMKMYAQINWAEFQEKYGTPFVVANTDLMNEQVRNQVGKMLSNFGSALWAVVNTDDKIQMIESKGEGETYKQFMEYVNNQLAIYVLGQTLTSQSQVNGTEALGKIHSSILQTIIDSDLYYIESIINDKLLPVLKYHGLVDEDVTFKFKIDTELSVTELTALVESLAKSGYRVDPKYLEEKLNIPLIVTPEASTEGLDTKKFFNLYKLMED